MAKRGTRNQSTASLQREISKLKKLKKVAAERKKLFEDRAKAIKDINVLRREARELKGVGSKRRVAGQIAKKIGTDAGRVGLKGLKMGWNVAKGIIEREARSQELDRQRAMKKTKSKPKSKPKRRKKKR